MSPQRREGLPQPAQTTDQGAMGRGVSRGPSRMSFHDLHALVKSMEARMDAQDKEIQVLKKDNAELWQEIHRLKGPRFPFEIFSAIILSYAGDTEALKTFSLVSWSWMSVTRRVLFKEIQHSAVIRPKFLHLIPILSDDHCTVLPFVRHIDLTGTANGRRSGYSLVGGLDGMDDFLCLLPKFVTLRSLVLTSITTWELEKIQHSIPSSTKNNIKAISIVSSPYGISRLADFLSNFTALSTLTVLGQSHDIMSGSVQGVVPPPSSIRELVLDSIGRDASVAGPVLTWFNFRHAGIIDSIDANNLPFIKPFQFRRFLARFGSTLSKIKFIITDDERAAQFVSSGYCEELSQLKTIQLDFRGQILSYSYFDKSFLSSIGWLPKILDLLPTSIEEISIRAEPDPLNPERSAAPLHQLGTIQWSQLDGSLSGPKYPLLRILRISTVRLYRAQEANKHLEELWPRLLPICADKGILEIEFSDSFFPVEWENYF